MYLRITKGKKKKYLMIVRGYRVGKKVKQKVVRNLGEINEKNAQRMMAMGKKLLAHLKGETEVVMEKELIEHSRVNWGVPKVIKKLWKAYDLDKLVGRLLEDRKVEYNLEGVLQLMLMDRLCEPCSKLATFNKMSQYEGIDGYELHDLYRGLDELDRYQKEISEHLFAKQKEYNGEVEVVFFDVTTLYFESQRMDDLRKFGYSKDCKFNEVQIVVSLLVNAEGIPFAYELFPGNIYEGHTLVSCLMALKEKYAIKKVVLVADRGMYSADNLQAVRQAGFEYVVGATIRRASKEVQSQVLSHEGYHTVLDDNGDVLLKHKMIQITHKPKKNKPSPPPETIVCVYSPKRASKDRQDRERLVQKAFELVESGQIPNKRGAQKYLKIVQTKPIIDEAKIDQDSLWDGFYAISSNSTFTEQAIIKAYSSLWVVEESFRTLKSYFEARPVFHWTPKRISGHIMLNFIALIFERFIESALKKSFKGLSPQKIRDALYHMQKSLILSDHSSISVYSELELLQRGIFSLFSIQLPKPLNK